MSELRRDLSREEERELVEGLRMLGFECDPSVHGYYIYLKDPHGGETTVVGRVNPIYHGGKDYQLEIFHDELPRRLKKKTGLLLLKYGSPHLID